MVIFHGSSKIIKNPKYGYGNEKNDYGLGFYCTRNIELAKEWACISQNINGYANKYEINLEDYKILDLTDKKYHILNWLAILLKFRTFDVYSPISIEAKEYILNNFYIDVEEYDIIIGYRADDSYFSFAKDFLSNTISIQKLSKAMQLGNLGTQVVLKSLKAFEKIKFIGYETASASDYYVKKVTRDKIAREDYFNNFRKEISKDDIFVIDLIRRGIKDVSQIL